MAGRASVRTISGFVGANPPRDVIDLRVDQDQVHVGADVTGSVRMMGKAPVKTVHIVLEGIEYSVVALPQDSDDTMGLEYLRKNTSETRTVIKQELLLDCAQPRIFRFSLPQDLPSTMKCQVEGSDPTLPSQCQIIYSISATIYGNGSKTKVTDNLVVLPSKNECSSDIPVDPSVYVSVGFTLDYFLRPFYFCGREETPPEENFLVLTPNSSSLRLSAGQLLKLKVRDLLGLLLTGPQDVWMFRLVEKVTWNAKGREARTRHTWDLFANQDEIPATVRKSYDQDPEALLKVRHELLVYYVATKASPSGSVLEATSTKPIPVRIVAVDQG